MNSYKSNYPPLQNYQSAAGSLASPQHRQPLLPPALARWFRHPCLGLVFFCFSPPWAQGADWLCTTVTANFSGANSVAIADVDSDTVPDIIGSSFSNNEVAWFKNDGSLNFTLNTVYSNGGPRCVLGVDLDKNGTMDILDASADSGDVFWFSNDGAQNFTRYNLDAVAGCAREIKVVDINKDGNLDVALARSCDVMNR